MKYLSKLLGMLLVGAMLYSTGCTDYDADIKDINNRIENLEKTQIEPLKKDLADTKTALENAIATAKSEILAKHEADVKDLKAADKEAQEAIAAALEAIKKGDAALDERLTTAEKAIQTATGDIADLKTVDAEIKAELKTISENLTAVTGDVESLKQFVMQMTEWSMKVQTAIDTLNTQIEGINKSIAALEADVKRIDEVNAAQQGEIKDLQDFQALAEAKFTALEKADADLATLIATTAETLRGELADYKDEVEKDFEEAYKAIAENATAIAELKADLKAKYDELVAKDQALAAAIKENKDLIASAELRIETLEGQVEEIQSKLDALTAEYNSFKQEALAAIAAAVERIGKLEGRATKLEADLTALQGEVAAFKAAYDLHVAAYEAFVVATNTAISNLQGLVDDVINRIQSIVYVPDYNDGKITVDYITFGGDILGGTTKIVYQVYPVEGAKAIADAFADPYNGFELSLELEGLKTRANEGPAMKINSVTAAENGRLTVEAAALNFPEAFYVDANFPAVEPAYPTEFAVSLVVDMTNTEEAAENVSNANLSTCYTMLTAGRADAITMAIYQNGEEVTEHPNYTKTILYTQISENPDFVALKDHYLMFTYKGEKYTKEQLAELGYFVKPIASYTELELNDSYVYSKVANTKGYNDPTLDIVKEDGNLVGTHEFFVAYAYPESDLAPVSACDHLVISREVRVATIAEPFVINWEYDKDANTDAALYHGDKADYARTLSFNLTEDVTFDQPLPADVKLADVLNVAFTEENEPALGMVATSGDKTANVGKIEFIDFDWDETYNYTLVYNYNSVTVKLNFSIVTVDRPREMIELYFANAEPYEYKSNLILDKELVDDISEVATKLLNDVNYEGWDAAEFMADNFVDHSWDVVSNTVGGVDVQGVQTRLVINGPSSMYTNYDYNDAVTYTLDVINGQLTYTKVITLWYNQQVKFTKVLTFGQPTIWFQGAYNFVDHYASYAESFIQPNWNPNSEPETALVDFDVKRFDLLAIFDLTDGTELYTISKNGENRGYVTAGANDYKAEFYLDQVENEGRDLYTFASKRGILLYNNYISYYGTSNYVDVNANLYLLNNLGDGSVKTMLVKTNFDQKPEGQNIKDYTNYRVNKYNPIKSHTGADATRYVTDYAPYYYDVAELFSIKDARGIELVNKFRRTLPLGVKNIDLVDFNVIDSPFLVVGDNENGFYAGKTPANIYGYFYLNEDGTPTNNFQEFKLSFDITYNQQAQQLVNNGILIVDPQNGKVTFNYTDEVELLKPIEITVKLSFISAWETMEQSQTTAKLTIDKKGTAVNE